MNTLETLVPSMVELLAAENQNFFHFASSQSPHLERASLYETAAPSLSMETLFAIRQEKERASGQEKLLLKLIEAAFLRFQERGKTLPHIDNLLNALSISGIEFPTEKGNFWQAAATLRELEQGEGRQQIGVLVDRRASQSMDLCARILEGRLGLCEEQEWKDAQERCCVLWATPNPLSHAEVDSLLSLTNDSYRDLLSYFSQKLVGESPATLKAVDLPRLLNSPAFDPIFSQGAMAMAPERSLRRMELDLKAAGRVVSFSCGPKLPWGEAVTLPLDVPGKIVLLYSPQSGIQPFESYLREMGQALYLSALEESAPLSWRWFGDPILRIAYGHLWSLCLLDRNWLQRVLKASRVKDLLMYTTFRILYRLRVWTGVFRFEAWLYPNGAPGRAYREWSEILRETCQVEVGKFLYLQGICEDLPAVLSLEGISLAAQLGKYLRENFNEDWFLNPKAGKFLRDLWHQGPLLSADGLWSLTGGPSSRTQSFLGLLEETLK